MNQYSYQPNNNGCVPKSYYHHNNPQPTNYGYEEDSDYDSDYDSGYDTDYDAYYKEWENAYHNLINHLSSNDADIINQYKYLPDHGFVLKIDGPNYGLHQNNTHEPTNYGYEEDSECDENNYEPNYGFHHQNSVNRCVEPINGSNPFNNEVVQPSHGYAANKATNKSLADQKVEAHVVFTQASEPEQPVEQLEVEVEDFQTAQPKQASVEQLLVQMLEKLDNQAKVFQSLHESYNRAIIPPSQSNGSPRGNNLAKLQPPGKSLKSGVLLQGQTSGQSKEEVAPFISKEPPIPTTIDKIGNLEKVENEDIQISFCEDQDVVLTENCMSKVMYEPPTLPINKKTENMEELKKENLQIVPYKDQNMVQIESSMIGQTTTLGGLEYPLYLDPKQQENSNNYDDACFHVLQKHEIHGENSKASRLGVKHGWPPPMVQESCVLH